MMVILNCLSDNLYTYLHFIRTTFWRSILSFYLSYVSLFLYMSPSFVFGSTHIKSTMFANRYDLTLYRRRPSQMSLTRDSGASEMFGGECDFPGLVWAISQLEFFQGLIISCFLWCLFVAL